MCVAAEPRPKVLLSEKKSSAQDAVVYDHLYVTFSNEQNYGTQTHGGQG